MDELDGFTRETFEVAYRTLKRRKREVDVQAMKGAAWETWIYYRDTTIERWAEEIETRVPPQKLEASKERVHQLLFDAGEDWEPPCEEDGAFYAAYGLAVLRWINREAAGHAPVLRYTDAQLDDWILRREPRQLKLF